MNGSAFDEDVEDDHADLGIRLGKLRISDRIGGFFRPRMVEEVRASSLGNTSYDTDIS